MSTYRNFMYLDGTTLYSMYSQIFGGIPETNFIEHASKSGGSASSLLNLWKDSHSEDVREGRYITLYDYLYTQLEQKLKPPFIDGKFEKKSDFLVKFTGTMQIQDFKLLTDFLAEYENLGVAITNSQRLSVLNNRDSIKEMISNMDKKTESRKIQALQKLLKSASNPKEFAQGRALNMPPSTGASLRTILNFFYGDAYHAVFRDSDTPGIQVRAILNKPSLRQSKGLIRQLMRGEREHWTVVGHLVRVSDQGVEDWEDAIDDDVESAETSIEFEAGDDGEIEFENDSDGVTKSFENMFNISGHLEAFFSVSPGPVEYVLSPLAIYKDYLIPDVE